MWVYAQVDGEVREFFEEVIPAIGNLEQHWDGRPEAVTLLDLFERLESSVAAAGTLVKYADATPEQRSVARTAYFAHVELMGFLKHQGGFETLDQYLQDATYIVQDCLDEWQPYISVEDQAENLVILDGVDRDRAIAEMTRIAALPPQGPFDDDCPLCRELAAMERSTN